jgi:GTP1/Obg family GTP-binding protein
MVDEHNSKAQSVLAAQVERIEAMQLIYRLLTQRVEEQHQKFLDAQEQFAQIKKMHQFMGELIDRAQVDLAQLRDQLQLPLPEKETA